MADPPPALPDPLTRCPGCGTLFRVTTQQLAARGGTVRCGRCKTVFDAPSRFVAPGAVPAPAPTPRASTPADGPAAVTPWAPEPTSAPETPAAATPAGTAVAAAIAPAEAKGRVVPGARHERKAGAAAERTPSRGMQRVWALAIVLLVTLLGAQAVVHFASTLAARFPETAPALARFCDVAGCTIQPLRDASLEHLAIDASDLQPDPAHRGLLLLTATLRNRAGETFAFPHLELTLTDAQDQVMVRRVLAPAEYVGGTVDIAKGIGANGAVDARLFIDASALPTAGYRLYLFYP
jgi:predicted Zn finger-like uncharacterized protein